MGKYWVEFMVMAGIGCHLGVRRHSIRTTGPIVSAIRIFPNPTSSKTWIDMGNRINKDGSLRIIDLSGNEVWSQQIHKGSDLLEVAVDGLSTGLYLVNIIFKDGQTISEKLMIKR